jgi:uncharacterized iron-regulated membrane protein
MAWLHTWAGVSISALLFAIFWMGTLSVFDREIDRWMMPMTRLQPPAAPVSLDATVRPVAERLAARSSQWNIVLPTDRVPTLRLTWRDAAGKNVSRHLDPATGAALPDAGTHAGTGFIYPFHYRLHITFMDIGYWLVGFAAMAMLLAIVSGVVIHKKILTDFFTFRPRKHIQRAALDLHNLSGVLALPFHFVIALSGLMIFFAIYFPSGWQAAYDGNRKAFNNEAAGTYQRDKAKVPGTLGSLDAIVSQARRLWGDGEVGQVRVYHPGDANSYVEVRRSYADRVTMEPHLLYFDARSAELLARADPKPVRSVQRFISGLHMIQFEHWTLRWLYFLAGLAGCVMIATGLLVWLESRRVQHARKGLAGVRVVEALAIAAVPGILVATLAFFVANRLLPLGASFAGGERADLEMWVFYLVWGLSLVHAAWRARVAWAEQCRAIALLALTSVPVNWVTTGDHLLRTLSSGLHGVAGMDALLLLTAVVAGWSARRLRQRSVANAAPTNTLSAREADYA